MHVFAALGIAIVLGGSAAPPPSLRAVEVEPLTVRGMRFKPNERVKLLVSTPPSSFSRTLRAGPRGGFVVRLGVWPDECSGVVVQAFGSRGSRATLHLDAVHCASPSP